MNHCGDLSGDRALGDFWEHQFCRLAASYGRSFTPHQIGREQSAQAYSRSKGRWNHWTLPDITIWTSPGEHHEIKHKDPTNWGFGLERYRLEALRAFAEETGQSVYYTIHDYSKQPSSKTIWEEAREERKQNRTHTPEHWVTCAVTELADCIDVENPCYSYIRGKKSDSKVPTCYWSIKKFQPVIWMWRHESPVATPKNKPPNGSDPSMYSPGGVRYKTADECDF